MTRSNNNHKKLLPRLEENCPEMGEHVLHIHTYFKHSLKSLKNNSTRAGTEKF